VFYHQKIKTLRLHKNAKNPEIRLISGFFMGYSVSIISALQQAGVPLMAKQVVAQSQRISSEKSLTLLDTLATTAMKFFLPKSYINFL